MRLLLTGAKGQLGHSLAQNLPAEWDTFFADKIRLDITRDQEIRSVIKDFKPNIIINAAAYTSVDKAEIEKDLAYAVNAHGARLMARGAKACGAKFFHLSTDYVFDGESTVPYSEEDNCNPFSIYGDSKRQGEIAVLSENADSIILRTSWVYSEYGQNFLKTMRSLILDNRDINVVGDQIGCPTSANDIANIIYHLANLDKLNGGIYHYAGDTTLSWYDFSKIIAEKLNKSDAQIKKVTSEEFKSLAKRPKYSVMDCSKIVSLGLSLSNFNEQLHEVLLNLELTEKSI